MACCKILQAKKSVLLLGPRQTGKTTALKEIQSDWFISLLDSSTRLRYERDPGLLKKEVQHLSHPLIVIDEIQKIPALLDVIQDIIDQDLAQFILTGSSARKLRRKDVNLLPGRVINLELSPLSILELSPKQPAVEELLVYGSLPGIIQTPDVQIKELLLQTYVSSYLEEEIRAEALVRNVATFSHFLELAANEAGRIINMTKLSHEIGVSRVTIQEYYQILLDTLVMIRVESFGSANSRRQLVRSPKYFTPDRCAGGIRHSDDQGLLPHGGQRRRTFSRSHPHHGHEGPWPLGAIQDCHPEPRSGL